MSNKEPGILDHEYDGIQEYDNPTPGWWHIIFIVTVLFSVLYIPLAHFSDFSTSVHEAWQQDQVADYKRIFGSVGDLQPDEATIQRMRGNEQLLAVAQSIFVANCAVCHGKEGAGNNGPNLTDDSYKNIKKIDDLFAVITRGANLGAMPAWEQKLSKNERVIIAAYVANLRGKNLSGRAAEGEKIPAWPAIPAAPSTPDPKK